ncbi:DUF6985 domain-containing protein [Corynebacterium durum]|uniref:DUF6985 domain-containing protein n=1 Tax=Corynebacterium durum TaxID=61592 RepID=UPI0028891820|nr:hypothetical protein [Corynebacterium durum]
MSEVSIPGVGHFAFEEVWDEYTSADVVVPGFGGLEGHFYMAGNVLDAAGLDRIGAAITAFLSPRVDFIAHATPYVFQQYQDWRAIGQEEGWGEYLPSLSQPELVWDLVQIGNEFQIVWDETFGGEVYIKVACSCEWDVEDGLILVFKGGSSLCTVGFGADALLNKDGSIYQPL